MGSPISSPRPAGCSTLAASGSELTDYHLEAAIACGAHHRAARGGHGLGNDRLALRQAVGACAPRRSSRSTAPSPSRRMRVPSAASRRSTRLPTAIALRPIRSTPPRWASSNFAAEDARPRGAFPGSARTGAQPDGAPLSRSARERVRTADDAANAVGSSSPEHQRAKRALLFVQIFFGNVVFGDFVSGDFRFVRVRRVLDPTHRFRLERLSLFRQLFDAF